MLQRRITGGGNGAVGRPPGVPKAKPIVLIDETGEQGRLQTGRPMHAMWSVREVDLSRSAVWHLPPPLSPPPTVPAADQLLPRALCPPALQVMYPTPPCASRRSSLSCRCVLKVAEGSTGAASLGSVACYVMPAIAAQLHRSLPAFGLLYARRQDVLAHCIPLQLRHRDIRALDPAVQLPCEQPPQHAQPVTAAAAACCRSSWPSGGMGACKRCCMLMSAVPQPMNPTPFGKQWRSIPCRPINHLHPHAGSCCSCHSSTTVL